MGKGETDFWKDNWLGVVVNPYFPSSMSFYDGIQRIEEFQSYLTVNQLLPTQNIKLQAEVPDMLVFTPFSSGQFFVSKCFGCRTHAQARLQIIWNKYTSYRVNAFIWHLYHNALSVFICCRCPQSETVSHLLVNSEFANIIWRQFASILHIHHHAQLVDHLIRTWLAGTSR